MILQDNVNSKIWKDNIQNIFNDDDLIIIYKWIYDKSKLKWSVEINNNFEEFCKKNNIRICREVCEGTVFVSDKISKFLCTLDDTYFINDKFLNTTDYLRYTTHRKINLDLFKNKKIFGKIAAMKQKNFISFPVGIYDRIYSQDNDWNTLEMTPKQVLEKYRLRTQKPIKNLIFDNYLQKEKKIINYVYFLQTISPLYKYKHPLYYDICSLSSHSSLITHTLDQENHWNNLNSHLFNLCLSWNTIESPRLWESLYFGCIPIVLDIYEKHDFIEKNYSDLPILHITNINNLFSEEFLINKYKLIMSNVKKCNFNKLRLSYWKNILLE